MELKELPLLYKETRLNLEPSSPAAVVQIQLPAGANGHGRRAIRQSNTNGAESNYAEEERAYRSQYLSTVSSIYHRKHHGSPRSFLWRVLERGHVLSIRAVDVYKHQKTPDSNLVLHIRFPIPLRQSCIALADSKDHDSLCIFALDESFQLYHILLRPDAFQKRTATENGLGDACKPFLSTAFQFKQPHRLVAINADEFVVTLQDGGIISFSRDKAIEVPANWKPSLHSPVTFMKGLRNILPFQGGPTIKYEGTNMEITAAASVALSSMDFDETPFLFTVCLDHRLRVWNLHSGEIVSTTDILGLQREPHELGKWTIDPSLGNLVRILEVDEGVCVCVTYSPVGAGSFMFWRAEVTAHGRIELRPYFDERPLVPPTPSSSDVWTLADFGLSHSGPNFKLWLLWKNNLIYRTTMLECKAEDIHNSWAGDWAGVYIDNSAPPASAPSPSDPVDATEKWLPLIFFPGRFSRATLETALTMYERGLGSTPSPRGSRSLAESICAVLGSTATLERGAAGGMDYEQFRGSSETQWRRFHRLLLELDKQRGEALSLIIDAETDTTWIVCTDCISVVRECSQLDKIYHNLSSPRTQNANLRSLLIAAGTFVDSFSDGMLELCHAALRPELYGDSPKTDTQRLQEFSDKAGFWRQVADEDCVQVTELLGENFKAINGDLYGEMLALFEVSEDAQARDVRYPLTQFGQKLVVRGTQDTADLHLHILLCQLILLVHMEFEFDEEDEALHSRLDVGLVYRQIIQALRRLEIVRWLARNEFSVALIKSERSSLSGSFSESFSGGSFSNSFVSSPTSSRKTEETQIITALEGSVGHLLGLGDASTASLTTSLTELVTDLCAPESTIELDAALIQCMLLKRKRPDLALELAAFADQDPFSTYIQGRVSLALRDYETAAFHFKRASVGLGTAMKHANRYSSAGLIDETEWPLFFSGIANYYTHIISLYDRPKAYSFVIDFARLAMQFTSAKDRNAQKTQVEIMSRLFTASTALARFDVAHSTLLSMTDKALQYSCLRILVERMCDAAQTSQLVALPFSGLQENVDDFLLQKCRTANEVMRGTQWHQILYAWRISHNDYRGAASILLDRIQKLQKAGEGDKLSGDDVLDTPVTKQYLMLINTLSCVDPKQAWVCTEDLSRDGDARTPVSQEEEMNGDEGRETSGDQGPAGLLMDKSQTEAPWRKVVTLADLRKQYQAELDRIAAIQNNQFGFVDDEAMDIS